MKCAECPDYTECRKKHNLTIKRKNCPKAKDIKVPTNADRIRAMSDDLLATQLTQIFYEGVLALTEVSRPNDILTEIRSQLLEKIQQPAEEVDK